MFFNSLSGRFLGLTIIFVMIAEVLIFVPSVANFRRDYLQNRLELSQLAALALLATPEEAVPADLESELLATADVLNVVLKRDTIRELALETRPMPGMSEERFDLIDAPLHVLMRDGLRTLFSTGDRIIVVEGRSEKASGSEIEIAMFERPLHEALVEYALRILYLSLAISMTTAAMLFFAVQRFIVRPIGRVVESMTAYRDDPEDATRVITPESGVHELREAETALQELQVRLTGALRQKDRLAALGGAVAKISHDLRNLLTTAQLLVDRIDMSSDPGVKRTAPKLVNSLARAIALCERTLTYGKAEEPAPTMGAFALAPLVEEVFGNESLLSVPEGVTLIADIPEGFTLEGDADQIFRVLTNLVRNAVQAIEATGRPGEVRIAASCDGAPEITISDTGPGLPAKARENLFQPFRGGVRQGGAGLGLVIASELVKGHGGTLDLAATGPEGTTFRIALPAPRAARPRAVAARA
jgi:signal transduction histidine kinase